jgi:hypothetical protein
MKRRFFGANHNRRDLHWSHDKLGAMCQSIATYSLYGLDAIPADAIARGDGVRVAERGSGRTLVDVKRNPRRRTPASVQSGSPALVRQESAPETMTTITPYLSFP